MPNRFTANGLKLLMLLAISFVHISSIGQNLTIEQFEVNDDGSLTFLLSVTPDHSSREVYDLYLYSSIDDFQSPVDYKYSNIEPGKNYSIKIDGTKYFPGHSGPIQFRFEVKASTFPVDIGSTDPLTLRQGGKIALDWSDYKTGQTYDVELYKSGKIQSIIAKGYSSTELKQKLDSSLPKGEGYELVIKPSGDPSRASDPIPVEIKKKLSMAVKLAPVGAALLVPAVIILGGSPDSGTTTSSFDDPPGPPSN